MNRSNMYLLRSILACALSAIALVLSCETAVADDQEIRDWLAQFDTIVLAEDFDHVAQTFKKTRQLKGDKKGLDVGERRANAAARYQSTATGVPRPVSFDLLILMSGGSSRALIARDGTFFLRSAGRNDPPKITVGKAIEIIGKERPIDRPSANKPKNPMPE